MKGGAWASTQKTGYSFPPHLSEQICANFEQVWQEPSWFCFYSPKKEGKNSLVYWVSLEMGKMC